MDSLRFNFINLLALLFVSYSFQTSLYSEDDPLLELNSGNFAQQVYGKSNAFIIEFYNSWCGHCIKFAPTWKEMARDTQTWKSVIDIAAVNCNDKENTALCRQYDVQVYPFIKLFWHNVNESEPGKVFTGTRDIPTMESTMISFLESHWSEGVPPDWPNLLPIEEPKLDDIVQEIPDSKQSILVFVEHSDSFVGRKIILDLSFQKDHIIRRLPTSDELFQKLKSVQSNETVPALIKITRDSKEELLLSFSKEDTESYIRDKVFEQITGESRNKTKAVEEEEKIPIKTVLIDHVYLTDLENAVYYSLNQEVGVSKYIRGEKISALKAYLAVLMKYFPGSKPVKGFLSNLHSWISYKKQSLTGAEFVQAIEMMQSDQAYLPKMREWVGCKGSDPKYRGYPCSLWTLFHTLTVQRNLKAEADGDDTGDVLFVVRDYIRNFFSCGECAHHFLEMAEGMENNVTNSEEAVLWLWRAHNIVNRRLAGDITEDPEHPKIQFPSTEACPQCIGSKGGWKMSEVLSYLRHLYGKPVHNEDPLFARDGNSAMVNSFRNVSVYETWTFQWFTNTDISLCVSLYLVSLLLLVIIFLLFRQRRKKRKLMFANHVKLSLLS